MAELLSGSHADSSLDLTRGLPESVCFMHDGAPAVLPSTGCRLRRHAVGSLLSPFSHILAFLCISIGFHCHILCNNISLFSPLALQDDTEIAEGGRGGTDGYPEDQSLTHPSPSLPVLASPSYLPLVPHFPPSRGQSTTRDSVGVHTVPHFAWS